MSIRTVIVDDEPLAREGIRRLLSRDRDIDIVDECSDGVHAVEVIKQQVPDLVFLDVQMPEIDGFGVVQALSSGHMPLIIFVTAFDRFALHVFDVHAQDYLLKPVDPQRFHAALAKAKDALNKRRLDETNQKLLHLLEDLKTRNSFPSRIPIRSDGKLYFLQLQEIDWIEAAGDYVRIHARGEKHILRETMKSFESSLDPNKFVRVHRSTIINIDQLKELQPFFHGEYCAIMKDGTKHNVSRTYRERIEELFRSPNH